MPKHKINWFLTKSTHPLIRFFMCAFLTPDVIDITHRLIPMENMIPEIVNNVVIASLLGLKLGKNVDVSMDIITHNTILIIIFIACYLNHL